MEVGAVQDGLAQLLDVPGGDGLRVGQLGGKHLLRNTAGTEKVTAVLHWLRSKSNDMYHRDSYLVGPDVHVRADDGSRREVDSFAHHVFPEQSVLLLQDLKEAEHLNSNKIVPRLRRDV